ncbi:MAG: hypothetical protein U9R15_13550 [Chloroflexota bacterium]|nr:hypothetical protein [Chloroflexota bacterium]
MDAILVDELNQVLLDLRTLQMTVEALQEKMKGLMSRVQEQAKASPKKFADLKGILGGVNLSYEEIKAAEYKVPEDLL